MSAQVRSDRKVTSSETDRAELEEAERESRLVKKITTKGPKKKTAAKDKKVRDRPLRQVQFNATNLTSLFLVCCRLMNCSCFEIQ